MWKTNSVLMSCILLFGCGVKAAKLRIRTANSTSTDNSYNSTNEHTSESPTKTNNIVKVCIIGAGVAGLTSARHLKEAGIDFVFLESTNYVGGTWRYDERVGTDEYGRPIHTSMYKNLRTNAPKITMELSDFPILDDAPSFLPWQYYYNYLKAYAIHFDLEKRIKFLHEVTLVKRVENHWIVQYKYMPTGRVYEKLFEYVIVATGHNSHPHVPNIPGEDVFKGTIIHSHDYREPEPYKCKRVLVVGAGASALDIGIELDSVSSTVIHSHIRKQGLNSSSFYNYIGKPAIVELNETGALFVDGTFEQLDDIIYCTGYEPYFPFLDESCELMEYTNDTVAEVLYKKVVNIRQPTMLVMKGETVITLDAQARYVTAYIKGDFNIPSREDMYNEFTGIWLSRLRHKPSFIMILLQEDNYYAELSRESGIQRIKPVITSIIFDDARTILSSPFTYRNYNYTIIDDVTYTKTFVEKDEPPRNITCPRLFEI